MIHDFLIVGAGLSGLKAASDLHAAGHRVLVLDKGRGIGGRAATRRWDGVPVDHGAQFFTARSDEFRAQTDDWLARGVCFPWCNGFSQWDDDGRGIRAPDPTDSQHPRFACHAGMSALGKDLARSLPAESICLKSRVATLRLVEDYWQASLESSVDGGDLPSGRCLILALPVTQALELLKNSGLLDEIDSAARRRLATVEYAPTLAVILRGLADAPAWKGIQLRDKTLSWISDDTSKRGAEDSNAEKTARIFVLHASSDFSREWQDADLSEATRLMVARAGELVGDWIVQLPDQQIHRWRYAHVPLGIAEVAFLQIDGNERRPRLYVCGDAFNGSKIEGAYCSGLMLANALKSIAGYRRLQNG
jgi:renalase